MLLWLHEVSLTIYNFWYSEHINNDKKKLRKEEEGECANGLQFCGLKHLRIKTCMRIQSTPLLVRDFLWSNMWLKYCGSVGTLVRVQQESRSWHCVPPPPCTGLYFFKLVGRFPPRIGFSKYHRIFSFITTVIADFIFLYKLWHMLLLYDTLFHILCVWFHFHSQSGVLHGNLILMTLPFNVNVSYSWILLPVVRKLL